MNNPPYIAQGLMANNNFMPNSEDLAKLINQQK